MSATVKAGQRHGQQYGRANDCAIKHKKTTTQQQASTDMTCELQNNRRKKGPTRAAALLTHTGVWSSEYSRLIFIVHMSITTPNTYLVSPGSNQVGSFLHEEK